MISRRSPAVMEGSTSTALNRTSATGLRFMRSRVSRPAASPRRVSASAALDRTSTAGSLTSGRMAGIAAV
jgi:hypothetical protein